MATNTPTTTPEATAYLDRLLEAAAASAPPRVFMVDQFDLMAASWVVAMLLLGSDDGSAARDAIETQIAAFLVASFGATDRPEKGRSWPALPLSRHIVRANGDHLIPPALDEVLKAAEREFDGADGDQERLQC